ncbi:MAG TPA: IclR family transcriptional regulator [Candidatus Deferrimicrobiaceae bacterium]|nr:IclR family transcriptional regulator [Candidatus Deferrimicrobiaceae bacterium]
MAREVAGIVRAMQVLEALAISRDGSSVKDLSRAIGCGKGTISKMLGTLERRHYVRRDAASGRFSLTWRLLALAFGHADQAGMPRVFLPVLQELADETDELVQLAVVDGDQVLFVAKAEGRGQTIRLLPLVGLWAPLHATAAGKLWLSTLPARELARVLGRRLPAVAPKTITSIETLRRELERVRAAGYALADEELAEGGRAIAAPITREGVMVGAVALSGPAYRLSLERLRALAGRVTGAAARLASIWPPHVSAKDFTS